MSVLILKPAIDGIVDNVPAPILWGAGGAAACCAGLCVGLKYVNPLAFEILMADEDDEDAINKAIGQSALNMFAQSLVISVVVNGCVSLAGFDSNASIGCCAASFAIVGFSTAYCKLQEVQQVGADMAEERRQQLGTQTKAD